jgi:hypothetical protein
MDDPPPYPGDDTVGGRDGGSTSSAPRWVKVSGIITVVLVLLFVIMHLTGHGLGGHTPGGHTPPSSVTGHGAQQP